MNWRFFDEVLTIFHSRTTRPTRRRVRLVLEQLEDRTTPANLAPHAPLITEPAFNGVVTSAFDTHMVADTFSDPNPGDTHVATDWQIWTTGASAQPVWVLDGTTDPILKIHVHLADGTFINALAGKRQLDSDTDYELRTRVKDSSGDIATQWSAWSVRTFHTAPELDPEPGVGTWAVRQAGYKVEEVASGFQLPVNIAFVPNPEHEHDPLFYVTELYGQIKVVTGEGTVSTYASNLLNFDPTGEFPGSGEQGVAGVVVDPVSGDLFVTMVYDDQGTHFGRVERLHSNDGGFTMATRTTLLAMPDDPMGQSHQISNISFGPDGKLYVHVGDGFDTSASQDLDLFRGKIIRMNLDGTAPSDNPFYNLSDGITARDYVYAYGFRNPFGGAWREADGAHYEVENGPTVDRFAKVVAGRNYRYDGTDTSMENFALYNWDPAHAPTNLVFLDGAAFTSSAFPASDFGHAFVAESGPTVGTGPQNLGKRISEFVLDANGNLVQGPTPLIEYNGTGYSTVVGLAAGPDGLYFTDLYSESEFGNPVDALANVLRVRYIGTAAPSAPSFLNAAALDSSRVRLAWTDNSDNEQSFKIEQSTNEVNFVEIATVTRGVTTYDVVGLQTATTYTYRVRGFNADFGNGAYSNVASATTQGQATIPAAPASLSAAGNIGRVQLAWPSVTGAATYNIYRATASGAQGTVPYATGLATPSYADTAVNAGVNYYYTVSAVNSAGEGVRSVEAFASATAPAAPTGFNATAGVGQIALSWTGSSGAASYTIYRSTTSGAQGTTPYRTGVTTTSFTDTGLTPGTTYYYKVSAVAGLTESAMSAEAFAIVQAPPAVDVRINFQPAPAPTFTGFLVDAGLTFGARGNGYTYGWDHDTSGGLRDRNNPLSPDQRYDTLNHFDGYWEIALPNGVYTVHLAAGDPGYFDSVHRLNVEGVLLVNGTPTASSKWIEGNGTITVADGRLTITAASGAVNPKINFIEITSAPQTPPPAPGNLTATAGTNQVALSWSASAGATSYNIYRATTSGSQSSTPYQTGITATTFTDTNAPVGATYYYKVTASNGAFESARSAEAFATPTAPALPAAPTNVNATAGVNQVTLTWNATNGATSYKVYRATVTGGQGATPIATVSSGTSYVDSGLIAGTTYYYTVSAVNSVGESTRSAEANATPQAAPALDAHINFQPAGAAVPVGYLADTGATFANRGNGFSYGWSHDTSGGMRDRNDPAALDQRYDTLNHIDGAVWEFAVANGTYTVHVVAGDPSNFDSVHRINVEGILAVNGTPTSAVRFFEGTVTVNVTDGRITITPATGGSNVKINYVDITAAPQTPPAPPTNFNAGAGPNQVALTWTAVAGATSYNIYRSTSSGAQGTVAYRTGVSTNSFMDNGLTAGTTYFYKVTAVNGAGESQKSAEVFATPTAPALPTTPTGLTATAGANQVALNWTSVTGATSYTIYRSTTSSGQGTVAYRTGVTATSFTDTGLTAGVTYYYKVTAVNSVGEGPRSSEAFATPTAAPAFEAHINFQPATAPTVAGYLVDSGLVYGSRGNGLTYGWNTDNTGDTRDRDNSLSLDQRYDTLIHMGSKVWEISVPNGTYTVRIVAGDPSYLDSTHRINVEGVLSVNGTPTAGARWIESTITVTVTDGRLTIAAANGGVNVKLNYLDITAVA